MQRATRERKVFIRDCRPKSKGRGRSIIRAQERLLVSDEEKEEREREEKKGRGEGRGRREGDEGGAEARRRHKGE